MSEMFDVICFGGPRDGKRQALSHGSKGWEMWRPVIEREPLRWLEADEDGPQPSQYGREYIGSYVVESNRKRAVWIEARK